MYDLSDAGTVGGSVTENEGRLETGDIDASTPATSSTCPSCQATFDTMSSLVAHVTLSHGRRSTVRRRVGSVGSQRPFRCYRCWKTFTVEAKLRRHMLSHAENLKDFKCDVRMHRDVSVQVNFVFLYLSSSYDDDDADTNLRHASLSLASSTACCMRLSCSATSSLMHCTPSMFLVIDPDFFCLLDDSVMLLVVIILPPFLSHARTM